MSHEIVFRATLFTGWDKWLAFLPAKWQALKIAKRLPGPPDPVVIGLPGGSFWRVSGGHAEPCGPPQAV